MFLVRNTASQTFVIPGSLRAVSGGAAVTSGTLTISKDGTESASAGTLTHIAGGAFKYTPTAGETDCKIMGYVLEGTGAVTLAGSIRTTGADPNNAASLGLTYVVAPPTNWGTLTIGADGIVAADVQEYGGVDVTFADGTIQAVTGNVVRLAANAPSIDLKGRTFQAVAGTGASFAAVIDTYNTSTKDATLDRSASALDTTTQYIVGGIETSRLVVEGSETVIGVLRGILSLAAGNITGLPSAFAFKNQAGTTTRIAGTVDGSGNRTVTSVDFT
jgi:hypothetical protein